MARTSTVKFLDELAFTAKPNSGSGKYKRFQLYLSSSTLMAHEEDYSDNTALYKAFSGSQDVILVPITPITRAFSCTIGSVPVSVPTGTPVGMGILVNTATSLTLGSLVCTGFVDPTAANGDVFAFEIYEHYDHMSGTEIELEYIDSKNGSSPEFTRSVKEKGVIRQRKQNLDPERTLSISQKYQSRTDGFMQLAGREYVLKVTRMDDNFLVPTESDFYYQCYHNAPEPSGSSGAQDSTVSFDITYEKRVSIAE